MRKPNPIDQSVLTEIPQVPSYPGSPKALRGRRCPRLVTVSILRRTLMVHDDLTGFSSES
jgi:hypothetical protein